jgi:hypothetical protein
MRILKSLVLAAAAATVGGQAVAGGFAPVVPVAPPTVIVEPEAPRSTWGIILPLALLGGLIALAVANEHKNDDDDGDDDTVSEPTE